MSDSGIQLIEVRVRNFRSLRRVDVELDSLTVFIGENNSGKTSLLEALYAAIGSGRRILSADDIFLAKGEAKPPKERTIIIDLLFRPVDERGKVIDSFPEGSYWTAWWRNGIARDDEDNDFAALRTLLKWSSGKGEYVTERRFLSDWPAAETLEQAVVNEKYGSVASAKLEPIALYFMDAKRDMHDELQNRSSFWHKLIADPGLSDTQVEQLEQALSHLNQEIIAGSPVLAHVQTHLNDLYQTVSAEKDKVAILPLARHLRDLSRGMDISFSTPDAEAFPLTRHGMGTRSLAAVLTFRAYSEWRQQNAKSDAVHPMLALEEPEAHLHPQAQRALFNQIEAIPGQRIVSTHSPYIASQADIMHFRHFRKIGAETIVSQLNREDLAEDTKKYKKAEEKADESAMRQQCEENIRKINRMVLNTRGELLFARALVFFEGETEEQALPIFAKAYWGEHINTLGISMIGVDGSGNYFPFARLAESFSIPWFIFSDGEAETIKRLSAVLKKLGKPEQAGANDNIFVIPDGKDFEAYLIDEGYQDVLIDIISTVDAKTPQHKTALLKKWNEIPDSVSSNEKDNTTGSYSQCILEIKNILESNLTKPIVFNENQARMEIVCNGLSLEVEIKANGKVNEQTVLDKRSAIEKELSSNKTRYARPIAETITTLEDANRRFPPLIRCLFERMAQEPGLNLPGGRSA